MDLIDIPAHTRKANMRALFRRDAEARAKAELEAAQTGPTGPVTPALRNDPDKRALFLAYVCKKVMLNGAHWTVGHLSEMYRFKRATAYAIVKEARREMAAEMAQQTDELRAMAEARLEFLMRKSLSELDLTNYGRALKEWCRLHGLYRQDDTTMGDFTALIRQITAHDDAKVLDAEFTVKPEDFDDPEIVDVEFEPPMHLPKEDEEHA